VDGGPIVAKARQNGVGVQALADSAQADRSKAW
jgi:hypothetical protein